MNRWESYGAKDTQEHTDLDLRFIGVDMVRERSLLGDGVLARSENKRLRLGTAAPRPGTSNRNESSSRVRISSTVSTLMRAAASSIAHGMPSRRRQISM